MWRSSVTRRYPRRLLAASLSTVLVALTMLAAPAFAGDTRSIYIGNPGVTVETTGSISNQSATHPGGKTQVFVQVYNGGTQTINHINLLGGDAADHAAVNCLYPPPGLTTTTCGQPGETAQPSLAGGLTFADVFSDDADCSGSTSTSLSCDLGTLVADQRKSVEIIFATDTSATSFDYWLGAYTAESNSTGSNQDNFYATGTIATTEASCTANKDASYFLEQDPIGLSTADCPTLVATTPEKATKGQVSSEVAAGYRGPGTLSITDAVTCPDAYPNCYGSLVDAEILDHTADSVNGGVLWDIKWFGTNKLSGVIHYHSDYDPTNPKTYTVITFKKQDQCSAKLLTNCWTMPPVASKNNVTPLTFEAWFRTPDNGKGGGYF
jgi:hypothetical protein